MVMASLKVIWCFYQFDRALLEFHSKDMLVSNKSIWILLF